MSASWKRERPDGGGSVGAWRCRAYRVAGSADRTRGRACQWLVPGEPYGPCPYVVSVRKKRPGALEVVTRRPKAESRNTRP